MGSGIAVSGDFDAGAIRTRAASLAAVLPEGLSVRREPKDSAVERGAGQFQLRLSREQALLCDAYPSFGYTNTEEFGRLQWLLHCLNGLSGPSLRKSAKGGAWPTTPMP